MGTPYLSEIKIITWNFPPKGWAFCNGQFLPINQNQALFSLLGTMYGGNGQTTFALPDLRARAAMHVGDAHSTQGEAGGSTSVTLNISQLPAHNHFVNANNTNGIAGVAGITPSATKVTAQALVSIQGGGTQEAQIYGTGAASGSMHPSTIGNTGGSQPHENRQPYLALNFCIALVGVFPSRN
jgi:microcystin-dependent protein